MFFTATSQQNGRMRPYWHAGDMPSVFNPGSHEDLVAWHTATQGLYTTTSRTTPSIADDPVGSWTDLKGDRHANQSTSGKRPTLKTIGSVAAVQFASASETFLRGNSNIGITGAAAFTMVVAMRYVSETTYGTIIGLGTETSSQSMIKIQQYSNDTLYINLNGPNYAVTADVDFSDGFHVVSQVYNGSAIRTYVDGELVDTTSTTLALLNAPLQIGNSIGYLGADAQFADVSVSDVFVFNAAISDADREKYEQFLALKLM